MAKVIQDLWILTKSGIVVFSRVFDTKVDEQLFGALMTALNMFAQELSSGGLCSFELQSIKFTILKANLDKQEFLFVANSSMKVKERNVQKELKKISRKFSELYLDVLDDWKGDTTIFHDFEKEIEFALQDPVKNFWDELK